MGLENRQKTNQIFDGSKLNVPGQGIKTVKAFKDILKDKDSLFSPQQIKDETLSPKPSPSNSSSPRPTPTNTATPTNTPTNTITPTQSGTPNRTPIGTRTPTPTPNTTNTPTMTISPSKTIGGTPIPTRTNTPSNTQTGTINPTPSSSVTPTPDVTPTNTPTNSPSLTPNGCFCYDIQITQADLDLAYGNTEQIANGIITIQYFSCSEEFITLTATTAGMYYICNRKFETLNSFGVEALLVYTQLDVVYNNYLNPTSFSSTIITSYNPCLITNECVPPTTTPTMTQSQTPTNSATATITPSQTPSNTATPSVTPTNPPTPTQTPTNTQTPTLTPYICYSYDVTITQTDIDRASGNTGTNGVVSITYYSCDEVVEELEVTVAGVYTVCNKYIKSNDIYNTEIYLVYRQDDEAYNNYDNPSSFTSSFVRTSTICPTEPPPPPPPPCNPLDFEPLILESVGSVVGKTFVYNFTLTSNPKIIIDWGDGTVETFENYSTISPVIPTYFLRSEHTFTSNITNVKIYCCYFNLFRTFSTTFKSLIFPAPLKTNLNFIGQNLTNIELINISSGVRVYGDVSDISNLNLLENINFTGDVDLGGNIEDIPSNLSEIIINDSVITGNLNNINTNSLVRLSLTNNVSGLAKNTVTGDITSFLNYYPMLITLEIQGLNTVYGDISTLSTGINIVNLSIAGNNTITGNISFLPNTMSLLNIGGNNTIYGDVSEVPAISNILNIGGNNTLSGDIQNLTVGNCTTIFIEGQNTITGDIANFPYFTKLRTFIISGFNTLYGSLNDLVFAPSINGIRIEGQNTITGPVNDFMTIILNGSTPFNSFRFTPVSGGLNSTEVDYVLNQFTNRTFSNNTGKVISMTGANSSRTSNSSVAVTYLQSIGINVVTN